MKPLSRLIPRTLLMLWLCLALLPLSLRPALAQNRIYCISDITVDPKTWPAISARLRVVDGVGNFVPGLSGITVFENQQAADDVRLAQTDGPLSIAFLIDPGSGMSQRQKDGVRATMARLIDSGIFRDGLDRVLILMERNPSSRTPASEVDLLLNWTSSKDGLSSFIAQDFFAGKRSNRTKGFEGLKRAIDAIAAGPTGSPVRQAAAIVFITNRIEASNGNVDVEARDWAKLAQQAHIPIYAFQTDLNANNQAPVRALVDNDANRYLVINAGTNTVADALYTTIAQARNAYSLTFTSKLSAPGPRTVTLDGPGLRGVAECQGPGKDTYSFDPGQPELVLDNKRTQLIFDASNHSYELAASVRWPNDNARKATAQMSIDGRAVGAGEMAADGKSVKFILNSRDFAGKNSAEIQVDLFEDSKAPPIATQRFTVSIEDRLNQTTPAATPSSQPNPSPSANGVTILGSIFALGAVGAGLYLFLQRRRAGPPSGGWRANLFGNTPQVMATLTVLEGPHGRRGQKIKLVKPHYLIGRQGADIVFYADAQHSTVSRRHCSITRDGDMSFWITDLVSANGTRVNDRKLPANERIPLNNMDKILLGDVTRNGVLLEFATDNPTQVVASASGDSGQIARAR